MLFIYTDGACSGNPGPGGYGTVLKYGKHQKKLSEGFKLTTNNRMELLAVIKGLEAIKTKGIPVTIVSDSKYVVNSIDKGWIWDWEKQNFSKKVNADLWKRYLPLHRLFKPTLVWIKGHAGHPENEECDRLAVEAIKSSNLQIDVGYKKPLIGSTPFD